MPAKSDPGPHGVLEDCYVVVVDNLPFSVESYHTKAPKQFLQYWDNPCPTFYYIVDWTLQANSTVFILIFGFSPPTPTNPSVETSLFGPVPIVGNLTSPSSGQFSAMLSGDMYRGNLYPTYGVQIGARSYNTPMKGSVTITAECCAATDLSVKGPGGPNGSRPIGHQSYRRLERNNGPLIIQPDGLRGRSVQRRCESCHSRDNGQAVSRDGCGCGGLPGWRAR
jgi:hypothetical protein